MRHFITGPLGLLLSVCAAIAVANNAVQATPTPATKAAKVTPAASATTAGAATGNGSVPKAGGSGGGIGSNKGVSGQQIGPKKPKCPDPTEACPAEKVISK